MIHKLRQRHRLMWYAVTLSAPAVLAAALVTRPAPVLQATLPGVMTLTPPAGSELLSSAAFELDGVPIGVGVFGIDGTARAVMLTPDGGRAVAGADLLVYWTVETANAATLPDDATLLGTLAGSQARLFTLPDGASGGRLVFYSLAQQRLFDADWSLP